MKGLGRWFGAVRCCVLGVSLAAQGSAQPLPTTVDACGRSLRIVSQGGRLELHGLGAPIPLPGEEGAIERVELPDGVAVIVRTRTNGLPTDGALVACAPTRPPTVLWQGSLRWEGEDLGDRVRHDLLALELEGHREVLLGLRREAPRRCGAPPVLTEARRVDPVGGRLVPVALDPAAEVTVAPVTLRAEPVAPGTAVFVPRAAWASQGDARALFDNVPSTVWTASAGFVTLQMPTSALRLRALELTPAPNARGGSLTLLLEPGPRRFDVTLPNTAPSGGAWRVSLPEALELRCLTLVGRRVSLAAMALRTPLDDGPAALRALAEEAGLDGGEEAARLLVELGPHGAAALAEALPTMTVAGARRAVRLLATAPGEGVSMALVRALSRDALEDAVSAALRRRGATALAALASVVHTEPRAAALIAASGGPAGPKLRALAPALGADGAVWHAARTALRDVLREASREGLLEAWLAALPGGVRERSRALRVAAEALGDDATALARVTATARALWDDTEALDDAERFEVRYRVLPALAGDAEGVRLLAAVLTTEADPDLRAEAARVLARCEDGTEALLAALGDRTPRVRAAAAEALAGRGAALDALVRALAHDRWPSVRAAAALALAREPRAAAALLDALDDRSMVTVRAVLAALALNPSEGVAARLVAFVDEGRRNPSLRREAVEVLGARCDRSVSNDLERIAAGLTDPALPPWEQAIGHAALAALARIDAARARSFVARSEANAEALASVERSVRQGCRPPW